MSEKIDEFKPVLSREAILKEISQAFDYGDVDIRDLPRIARSYKKGHDEYMDKESDIIDIIGRKDLIAEEKVARILQVLRRGRMCGADIENSTVINKRSKKKAKK